MVSVLNSLFYNRLFKGFSKGKKKTKQYSLENKLKFLESNLNCDINSVEYINCKNKLEIFFDDIAKGIKVRSKCQCYEEGEKSVKFFLNLDHSVETVIELEMFFENLLKRKLR